MSARRPGQRPREEPPAYQLWFYSIPPVTRWTVTLALAGAVAYNFGILTPAFAMLDKRAVTRLQVWRLFTNVLLASFSYNFCFSLVYLYKLLHDLESTHYRNRSADLMWTFCIMLLAIDGIGMLIFRPYLERAMSMGITFLASRIDPDRMVSFDFGLHFRTAYFPLVLMGFEFFTTARVPTTSLIGIVAAQLVIYLEKWYPAFMKAPHVLQGLFSASPDAPHTSSQTPTPQFSFSRRLGK